MRYCLCRVRYQYRQIYRIATKLHYRTTGQQRSKQTYQLDRKSRCKPILMIIRWCLRPIVVLFALVRRRRRRLSPVFAFLLFRSGTPATLGAPTPPPFLSIPVNIFVFVALIPVPVSVTITITVPVPVTSSTWTARTITVTTRRGRPSVIAPNRGRRILRPLQ